MIPGPYNKKTYELSFKVTLEDTDDRGDAPDPSALLDLLHAIARDLTRDAASYGGRVTAAPQSCCIEALEDV